MPIFKVVWKTVIYGSSTVEATCLGEAKEVVEEVGLGEDFEADLPPSFYDLDWDVEEIKRVPSYEGE